MADTGIEVDKASVILELKHLEGIHKKMILNMETPLLSLIEAAASLHAVAEDKDQLNEFRDQLVALVQLKHECTAHQDALAAVADTYQPQGMGNTDFKQLLDYKRDELSAARPLNLSTHPRMQEFDQTTGQQVVQELGDDEDIAMVGTVEQNSKCPFSGKPRLEIRDPVEDQMGCVYERSFVEESIRKAQGQQLRAPFPGMNHHIRLSDLKVSSKLKREQRLAKLKHATQAQHTQEEDVVDV